MTETGPRNEVLLDGERIKALLEQLAKKLEEHGVTEQLTVLVAGGSCLALMGLRETTTDVDSLTPLPEIAEVAARQIAVEHGLKETWLNASAAAFRPEGLSESDCRRLIVRDSLLVLGVPPNALLLMKLHRANQPDQADMRRLWPHCTFGSATEVVTAYYEAYPAQQRDPYLVDFVQSLLEISG